jgi:hypothetical protein
MKQDWEREVKQAIDNLWKFAVNLLEEDKARELFMAVTKHGRGKRGPGRILGSPSKAAARMRRSYEEKHFGDLTLEVERDLTEEDLGEYDEHIWTQLSKFGVKKKKRVFSSLPAARGAPQMMRVDVICGEFKHVSRPDERRAISHRKWLSDLARDLGNHGDARWRATVPPLRSQATV